MKSRSLFNYIYAIYSLYELRYGKVLLNNYGYSPTEITKENALQLQFYTELMKAGEVSQTDALNICEVGCGQGHGGIYLLNNILSDKCQFTGLEGSDVAFLYCKFKHRKQKNARFILNRQGVPSPDNYFDVFISLETGIPRDDEQLKEIYRSLKPSGAFIFYETYDMAHDSEPDAQLKNSGFNIVKKTNVTANILGSMVEDNGRKLKYLSKLWFLPKKTQTYLGNYWGMVDSKKFEIYSNNHRNGFIYVITKPAV